MMITEKFNPDKIFHASHIIGIITDPFIILDNDGVVVFSNEEFLHWSNKDRNDVIGKKYGVALGCNYSQSAAEVCGMSPFCELCALRKSLENKDSDRIQEIVIRELIISGQPVVVAFRITVTHIMIRDNYFSLMVIQPLSTAELEKTDL